jgi:MoxR-like ATPase
MTPTGLQAYLGTLLRRQVRLSVMIWGPPGVGKSSIVARLAEERGLGFIDLRIGQLAPTDLRGLPVAEGGVARWLPPEFLPRSGNGILFLDEINMAPPVIQGIAQQLILDRRVGSYVVPEGWFIWAAGNRKEDRAGVFDMPAPLANRFIHLDVAPDLESFRAYAVTRGLHESIVAFLSYRPMLLHRLDATRPAWPSPRSWEMADALLRAELDLSPAVGPAAAAELEAFARVYAELEGVERVLGGLGDDVPFPAEPSLRYASTIALGLRAQTGEQAVAALRWLEAHAGAEWLQLYLSTLIAQMRARAQMGLLTRALGREPSFTAFLRQYQAFLGE